MALKAEMQSQETEPSNFYSSLLIEAEEDIQSGAFEAVLSHNSVSACQNFLLHDCTYISSEYSPHFAIFPMQYEVQLGGGYSIYANTLLRISP